MEFLKQQKKSQLGATAQGDDELFTFPPISLTKRRAILKAMRRKKIDRCAEGAREVCLPAYF
jgi:hypothetical protein